MQVVTQGTSTPDRRAHRADDVLAMQRSAHRGGTRSVLSWLAARTRARVFLVGVDGTILASCGTGAAEERRAAELARRGTKELVSRGLGSLVVDDREHTGLLCSLDCARRTAAPALAAVLPGPVPEGLPQLLADASSALGMCWQAEDNERRRNRLELVEAHNREAVLHLLMNGQVPAARQIAGVLRPALPDVLRFLVVESPPRLRPDLARRCAGLIRGAWVVPCPVHADHLLVLAPVAPGEPAEEPLALAAAVARETGGHPVGVSEAVPLRETATAYGQAFHALAAARGRARRYATFACRPDPVLVIGPALAAWAERLLAPLRGHAPRRPQDPDGRELATTAASWLAFSAQATAHLKIHRNTLSARLRQTGQLLALDLDRLADQSLLALALRAECLPAACRPKSRGEDETASLRLDDLLTRPATVEWAHRLLRPVRTAPPGAALDRTLDVWLRNDARLGPTATELALSATAVRKRLTRVEDLLERSLLRSPSDRHELWLAARTLDLAEAGTMAPAGTTGSGGMYP
ncbi:helix-turn-helix domain-containing protein [Streptomyces sp. UNOB3_S3]|uniref:helix-turn-helix domain-containing protein n=1 Tax=Streptomyces sp. UNOB3_S3 TaxID=2871682 RepID=UPI0027E2CB01|nr:helix-turn-helix domain-containing protein [Streptomyces sp. UNOB3_S3]